MNVHILDSTNFWACCLASLLLWLNFNPQRTIYSVLTFENFRSSFALIFQYTAWDKATHLGHLWQVLHVLSYNQFVGNRKSAPSGITLLNDWAMSYPKPGCRWNPSKVSSGGQPSVGWIPATQEAFQELTNYNELSQLLRLLLFQDFPNHS